ncbi:MAG TPA: STM4015 family protein [Gemmataceae bacterium]|jgi:predicted DNA-binding WGR domain protein
MTIGNHLEHFAGFPVKDYDSVTGIALEGHIPRREYQFVEGASKKFWAIELDGRKHIIQFGRIGSAGQTQTKEFKTPEQAQKAYEKLVHEKVGKGYQRITDAEATAAAKPSRKKKATAGALPVIYRIRLTYSEEDDERMSLTDKLGVFLEDPAAEQAQGLVIGTWGGVDSVDQTSGPIVEALVTARDKLPNLKHLFLGDIVTEENEVSWIEQSDVSPLLAAYPDLHEFRVRGSNNLSFGTLKHKNLKTLAVETGGLPVSVVREVCAAKLPALEHLELWLGEEDYGWDGTVADLEPLLSGKLFPKLRYLGLRDSSVANEVASAVAKAPVLKKIRVLDLSLGNLGDEGAKALLGSPNVAKLEKLDIHHHFVSNEVVAQLKALGIEVDASEHMKPWDFDPDHRYIAVSE